MLAKKLRPPAPVVPPAPPVAERRKHWKELDELPDHPPFAATELLAWPIPRQESDVADTRPGAEDGTRYLVPYRDAALKAAPGDFVIYKADGEVVAVVPPGKMGQRYCLLRRLAEPSPQPAKEGGSK